MSDAEAERLTVVLVGSDQYDPEHEPLETELYVEVETEAQLTVMYYAVMQALELVQVSGHIDPEGGEH